MGIRVFTCNNLGHKICLAYVVVVVVVVVVELYSNFTYPYSQCDRLPLYRHLFGTKCSSYCLYVIIESINTTLKHNRKRNLRMYAYAGIT